MLVHFFLVSVEVWLTSDLPLHVTSVQVLNRSLWMLVKLRQVTMKFVQYSKNFPQTKISFDDILPFVVQQKSSLVQSSQVVVYNSIVILLNTNEQTQNGITDLFNRLPLIVDGLFSFGILIKSVFSTPARQVTSPNVSPEISTESFLLSMISVIPETPIWNAWMKSAWGKPIISLDNCLPLAFVKVFFVSRRKKTMNKMERFEMLIVPVLRWKKWLMVDDFEGVVNGLDMDRTCTDSTSVL